ncbi:Mut7-C RNAse domain-containing protein [Thioflavicoccus mobilis]|uniref:Mut7-C RNAse domain-containing protein n=1 Tax=Thioflavicoccus mobilis TaxID=80679 RepID=UPI0002D9CC01|nr:Mut7-C RNAse domain-containing protein [Thioflavicoccus mobilis]
MGTTILRFYAELAPFGRCTVCNAPLEPTSVEVLGDAVPPGVRLRQEAFWRCTGFGHIYWKGSHWRAMQRHIAQLCPGHVAG